MIDMRPALTPKSDQLNTDDLISGPLTIIIRDVTIRSGEQPVSIFYEGDGGKPFKPCKSMGRVLVHCWGADAKNYIGRSATLYRDPTVKWAGMAVGGIRISHLSHIDRETPIVLTTTKGKYAPFSVKPLKESARKADAPGADGARAAGPQTATPAPPPKFRLIKLDGQPFDFPSADAWQSRMFEWIEGLRRDEPEALKTFRTANGPIIAELASAGYDQARAVDAKFIEAIGE